MPTLTLTAEETSKFNSRYAKTETCWVWRGTVDDKGYGRIAIRVDGVRKLKYAHRVAFETSKGDVPSGLKVDHICHNRLCVNPSHLRLLTHKQNLEHRAGPNKNNRGSGVRGVYWNKQDKRYKISVGHNGQVIHGKGSFSSIQEAEQAVIALRNSLHTHNTLDRHTA